MIVEAHALPTASPAAAVRAGGGAKKKLALVFPRFRYPSGDPPLGVAYIASYVRKVVPDAEVRIFDATFKPSFEAMRKDLAEFQPGVVGIFMDTISFNDSMKVASLAREVGSKVIAGGPHATILPDTVIADSRIDAIGIGEGEATVAEYLSSVYDGGDLAKVDGLWFKTADGEVVKTKARESIMDMDAMPFPAFDLLDMKKYVTGMPHLDSYSTRIRATSIIASRACPYGCTYCQPTLKAVFGNRYRTRSAENVIDELRYLKKTYGIGGFFMQDDTPTAFHKWVFDFCDALKRSGLGMIWGCNSRVDTVDRPLLRAMKAAGLVKIKYGIEAYSDRIRNDIYKKNVSIEKVASALEDARQEGVQTSGYFMLGAPTETAAEVEKSISFAVNSPLTEATFSIATPLPHTGLYNMVIERGWKLPDSFEGYDYYRARRGKMSENDIPVETLEKVKKRAVLRFYLHPQRLDYTLRVVMNVYKTALKLSRF